jgi:hypothetical protein
MAVPVSPSTRQSRWFHLAVHAVVVATDALSLVVIPLPLPVHIVILVTIHVTVLGAVRHWRHR